MTDPLGIISHSGLPPGVRGVAHPPEGADGPDGARFERQFLAEMTRQIDEVNRMQADADRAAEDLSAGRRSDVEGVMLATQKADTAFRMLLAVRNRMMEAYDEVKQIRV